MQYRVGKKQNRALLDDKGHEVALFNKGQEELAKKVCELLNKESKSILLYSQERLIEEARARYTRDRLVSWLDAGVGMVNLSTLFLDKDGRLCNELNTHLNSYNVLYENGKWAEQIGG